MRRFEFNIDLYLSKFSKVLVLNAIEVSKKHMLNLSRFTYYIIRITLMNPYSLMCYFYMSYAGKINYNEIYVPFQ